MSPSTYVLALDVRSRGVPGINHRIQAAPPITRPLFEPVVLLFTIAAVTTVAAGSTEHFVAARVQVWSCRWFLLTTVTTIATAVTNAFEQPLSRSAASFRPRRTCRRGPGGLEGGGGCDYDVTRRSKLSGLLKCTPCHHQRHRVCKHVSAILVASKRLEECAASCARVSSSATSRDENLTQLRRLFPSPPPVG